jgi:LEA14-like dessication related protein
MAIDRRDCGRWLAATAAALVLPGCAGLVGRDPVKVNLVGLEALPGEGMELRMAVKLRVQNPNSAPITYDGLSIDLDIRGSSFASGVSNQAGNIPRFGEAVIQLPVSISAMALLRQVVDFAGGGIVRVDYRVRGRLSGTGLAGGLGGLRFEANGEVDLPRGLAIR